MRQIVASSPLDNSDMVLGRLEADLPESIQLPNTLSINLIDSIADCKYLPRVCMNNRKAATVLELDSLNCAITAKSGAIYRQMGKTSARNVVSPDRVAVWSATKVGNSCSPVFLLAGNELIFLFSKHLGHKGEGASAETWGPVISYRLAELQNTINEWEGEKAYEYQIDVIHSIDGAKSMLHKDN